jgi:hypothetical protein
MNDRVGIITIDSTDPHTGDVLIHTGRLTLDGNVYRLDEFEIGPDVDDSHYGTVTDLEGNPVGEFYLNRLNLKEGKPNYTYSWSGTILGESFSGMGMTEWIRNKSEF